VQADRYNRRRDAVVIAAITTRVSHRTLPSKVFVPRDSVAGRQAGLRLDSVVDCQTAATIPRSEITRRLGRFPPDVMAQINRALRDALDLDSQS
jgi:mRNA-degrading endonuclease toxin of MazEF toxin-antitoxin module